MHCLVISIVRARLYHIAIYDCTIFQPGVGGKSVRQADVSGGTHFPRKFCPTGWDIQSASRIICPGLGGKSVRQENVSGPDLSFSLHSYKSSYEPACQNLIKTCRDPCIATCSYASSYAIDT